MAMQFPVEIWEMILKYLISVPLFFETDPASSFGVEFMSQYYYEANYWTSERLRNTARRVCSSWNIFLQAYNHRYVRLADVYQNTAPISAIPMAKRLNLEPDWGYKGVIDIPLDQEVTLRRNSLLRSAMQINVAGEEGRYVVWKTEILQGLLPNNVADVETFKRRAPRLRTVVGCHPFDMENLYFQQEAILFVSMVGGWQHVVSTQPFCFTQLNTLCVNLGSFNIAVKNWELPSLQHLSLHSWDSVRIGGRPDVILLLKKIGAKLLTFYLYDDASFEDFPIDLWKVLPHVVRVQLPYWGTLSPSLGHPVRFARMSIKVIVYTQRSEDRDMHDMIRWLPKWGPSWASLRHSLSGETSYLTFQMERPWLWVLTDPEDCSELALGVAEYYQAAGTRFTDSEGVSFEEYLIFILKFYWRDGCARHPRSLFAKRAVYF